MRVVAAPLLALLIAGCDAPRDAAPNIPGRGGTELPDPALAALGMRVHRYGPETAIVAAIAEQPAYRQDPARTGYVPGVTLADSYELAWELSGLNPGAHTAAKGSPAVAATLSGPRLIVGSDSGALLCLAPNGSMRWSAVARASAFGIHGTPAVSDGVVYVGAYDGALYAFALETGALLFRTMLGNSIGSSPLVHAGKVYVSVETDKPSGILFIVDAKSGEIIWSDHGLRDHPHSSVALDPSRNVMVVGDNSGDLTAWDLEPPAKRWVFRTGGAIKGPILLHEGLAILGSWDHYIYAVDLYSGRERWRASTAGRVMSGAALSPELGAVFIGSHDGALYALEASSGRTRWTFRTGARILSSPTVAGGRVAFGSNDGYLYLLDARSGSLVYRFKARGQVNSSPAVLGDHLVFTERGTATTAGSMYVLRPRVRSAN